MSFSFFRESAWWKSTWSLFWRSESTRFFRQKFFDSVLWYDCYFLSSIISFFQLAVLLRHFFARRCSSSFSNSFQFQFQPESQEERAPNGPQRPSKFFLSILVFSFFPVFSVPWLFYWMFLANGDHNDAISNRRREEKRRAKEWTKFEQKKKHTARSARQKNNGNKLNKLAKNHFLRDSQLLQKKRTCCGSAERRHEETTQESARAISITFFFTFLFFTFVGLPISNSPMWRGAHKLSAVRVSFKLPLFSGRLSAVGQCIMYDQDKQSLFNSIKLFFFSFSA